MTGSRGAVLARRRARAVARRAPSREWRRCFVPKSQREASVHLVSKSQFLFEDKVFDEMLL